MPYKICKSCGESNGVRCKSCKKCNAPFTPKQSIKNKNIEAIEKIAGGTWRDEKPIKGMPQIETPEPLGNGKLSMEEIKEAVRYEGVGYAILHYIQPEQIPDSTLRAMWKTCKAQMSEIVGYLE